LCPNKREIWHGECTCGQLTVAKFHVYRGNVSPLRGEKSIFGPLSERNTGMAALHAGLPVTNIQKIDTFSSTAGTRRMIPTILSCLINEGQGLICPIGRDRRLGP